MFYSKPEHEQMECACIALYQCLQELLHEQKINAMEFLSIVGQLSVKPADFDKQHQS